MDIPIFMRDDLEDKKLSRRAIAEIYDCSEEDVRAFRRLIKLENEHKSIGRVEGEGIVSWDWHVPYHDEASVNILYEYTKKLKPKYFILGGDFDDIDAISYYNNGKIRNLENNRLKKEYEQAQLLLDKFEKILPSDCQKVFIMGNHEDRVDKYLENDPRLEGFIEVENNLKLDDWKVIPFNKSYSLGHLTIIHGLYTNKYHSNKHMRVYGDNVYYGHTHQSQSYMQMTPHGNEPNEARAVGCMCNKNPYYMRGKPNAWVHEFLKFTMMSDGTFFPDIVRIINGRAVIDGEFFDGNKIVME